METTSVTALRSAQQDAPPPAGAEPPPQFAELTGAYWLEPIHDGLAQQQIQRARTVPGAPQRQWQIMALGREEATSGGDARRTPSRITG